MSKHNSRQDRNPDRRPKQELPEEVMRNIGAVIKAILFEAEIEGPTEEDLVIVSRDEYNWLLDRSARLGVIERMQKVIFPDADQRWHGLRSAVMEAILSEDDAG